MGPFLGVSVFSVCREREREMERERGRERERERRKERGKERERERERGYQGRSQSLPALNIPGSVDFFFEC